jgi:AcrR family transcriptional regulator
MRSFYQHFAGKHELLLALFEESVRASAEQLAKLVADEHDPVATLHLLVVEYYRMCRPSPSGRAAKALTPAMIDFAQELMTSQPAVASRAFVPLVAVFREVLADAAAAGAVRVDVDVSGVLLQAIMFNTFAMTISGTHGRTADDAEELWGLMLNGIAAQ